MTKAKAKEKSQIAAVVCREGLVPLTTMAETGRGMYMATRVNLIVTAAGALLGMRVFHHKTRHWYFKYGVPAMLLAQLAAGAAVWWYFLK